MGRHTSKSLVRFGGGPSCSLESLFLTCIGESGDSSIGDWSALDWGIELGGVKGAFEMSRLGLSGVAKMNPFVLPLEDG